MDTLLQLAELIRKRNLLERELTEIIGRPAQIGHIGEFIASRIFRIKLEESAVHKGSDGFFSEGTLAGRSVNIKWYAKREGLLDITPDAVPDYYLVLTGPQAPATSSRGKTRPWLIESVYLFDAHAIVEVLRKTGIKIGIASSIKQKYWSENEIYPRHNNGLLTLSEDQQRQLEMFGSTNVA